MKAKSYPMATRQQAAQVKVKAQKDWVAGKITTERVNKVISQAATKMSR